MLVYQVQNSTNIKKLYYNKDTKVLTVEFKNNSQYKYDNVSLQEYQNFTLAESKGKYLKEVITNKVYHKVEQLND